MVLLRLFGHRILDLPSPPPTVDRFVRVRTEFAPHLYHLCRDLSLSKRRVVPLHFCIRPDTCYVRRHPDKPSEFVYIHHVKRLYPVRAGLRRLFNLLCSRRLFAASFVFPHFGRLFSRFYLL